MCTCPPFPPDCVDGLTRLVWFSRLGTAVPIAYDLINKHYNNFGPRSVNINVISEFFASSRVPRWPGSSVLTIDTHASGFSVYLTPSYFLQYGFPNWNPGTIMKQRVGFNYDKYRDQENYPDLVWHHILQRGSNFDRWGFVTHSSDPVSLMFYQYMSGNGGDGRGRALALEHSETNQGGVAPGHVRRRAEDDDLESQWWSEISHSMAYAKERHRNVDYYVIDGEGHCSFGLYYPLREAGFEEWATPVVREGLVVGSRRSSVAAFVAGAALGGALTGLARRRARERSAGSLIRREDACSVQTDGVATTGARRAPLGSRLGAVLARSPAWPYVDAVVARCQAWPWTAGYLLATTVYFAGMLVSQGFAHPLDNPAFGPSAVGLSAFGINNPSLVVHRTEHFRLVTSAFLCSGITTYLLMTHAMYRTALEATMTENDHPHWHVLLVAGMISFGTNLLYSCVGDGASCSSLSLALGLNVFSAAMQRRSDKTYPSPLCFTISVFVAGCTPLLPFDSVVALASAVVVGLVLGLALFVEEPGCMPESSDDYHSEPTTSRAPSKASAPLVRWNLVSGLGIVYSVMYLLLLFRVPSPDKQKAYHPYLTGCGLVFSDQIGDAANAYANNDGGRSLAGNEEGDWFDAEDMCAQLCVPHVVLRPALWGIQKFASVPVKRGTCKANGYDEHVADHTIREFTVTLEVMLYTTSNEDNEE